MNSVIFGEKCCGLGIFLLTWGFDTLGKHVGTMKWRFKMCTLCFFFIFNSFISSSFVFWGELLVE